METKAVFISGTNDRYSIDERGRVWSHRKKGGPVEMKRSVTNAGQVFVRLMRNGKQRPVQVRNLMAECFMEPPENEWERRYKVVGFIDGDKTNCDIDNLHWVSKWEQGDSYTPYDPSTYVPPGRRAYQIKFGDHEGKTISQIAKEFDVSPSTVSLIRRGKRWGHLKKKD